jgi:hypothetical protein
MRWTLLKGHEGKKVKIKVNGHTVDAVVTIQWTYEDSYPVAGQDFDFGDQKENEAYEARFNDRDLGNVLVSVIARAEGLEGLDTLGGCHVKWSNFETDLTDLVNDHGMTENALEALKTEILDASKRLAKYATEAA